MSVASLFSCKLGDSPLYPISHFFPSLSPLPQRLFLVSKFLLVTKGPLLPLE